MRTDRAAVHINNGLANRKSQPQAAKLMGRPDISLLKGIEYLRQEFRRDTHARVANLDPHIAGGVLGVDEDAPAVRREFSRITQQVPEYLLHARRIGIH